MQLGDLRFEQPALLVLVVLLPIGAWLAARRTRRGSIRFSTLEPFRRIAPSFRVRLRHLVPALRVLALLALIVALARPQEGSQLSPERSEGIGILMAIDASGSMHTDDFQLGGERVRRIDAVKAVARDFIEGGGDLPGRPADQIGILAFKGYPIPMAPLTLDHGAVLEVIGAIDVPDPEKVARDRAGRPLYPEETATAIGDALAKGAQRLRDVELEGKVLILLSDGTQTFGTLDPLQGAEIAEAFGIKVYTIGIGSPDTYWVTVRDPIFGERKVPRRSDLDEETLRAIAEETGGKYFNAASTDALREVYAEIDQLERSEIETTRFYRWDERFQPLALAALGFLVVEVLLSQTVFRRLP